MKMKGFTLIELIVSVAIFSMVMVVALGSLLAVSAAERKGETLKAVMDNLNFAIEGMSRTIRTGYNFHCETTNINIADPTLIAQDCSNQAAGSTYFAVVSFDGTYTAYCLSNGTLWRQRAASMAGLSTSCQAADGFLPLTASEINISTLSFYVKGAPLNDGIQPKVVLTLTGSVAVGANAPTSFALQTTITQRIYDQ